MKEFLVKEELLQALYQYLMEKPMKEVEGLVNGIRQVKPVDDKNAQVSE